MLSTIQLPRPFQIFIDDSVLETLQTFSRFQEKSLISFSNHINFMTLQSGNVKLNFEQFEIFRKMIQVLLLITQREVFVQKWANIEYYSIEEYAGDVIMGNGDKDSVIDESTHHQPINDTMQRSNYSALLKVSRIIKGQQEDDKVASEAYTSQDNCILPPTLAAYGRCTRCGGEGVSRRYSMGFARSRSSSKLL